jgi:hypothetical protein
MLASSVENPIHAVNGNRLLDIRQRNRYTLIELGHATQVVKQVQNRMIGTHNKLDYAFREAVVIEANSIEFITFLELM